MRYVGIDYHKRYFVATVMDEEGKVIRKDMVSTDRGCIRDYFNEIKANGDVKAVLEACYEWSYFYDEIKGMVNEVKLAHPLKTRLIAEARIKTDSIDSGVLAHLLRADLIAEAHAPEFEVRQKKNVLRYRTSVVKVRGMLKNKIHAVLARNHIEKSGFRGLSDKFGKMGRRYMRGFELRGVDTEILNHYLDLIEAMDEKIKVVNKKIRETVKGDEICELLDSVPGVGDILAMAIRYEIDDIERFLTSKKLCSYSGLIPSTYSSGGKTYQGKITKQGNKWLRWALTEAAQNAIKKDPGLRSFYQRVAQRRGKNRAKIAVARKLLEIIYRIWKDRRPYYEKTVAVAL